MCRQLMQEEPKISVLWVCVPTHRCVACCRWHGENISYSSNNNNSSPG
ncbi:unnamed protein product [Ectocarpus sp. 12 AP-2014]